MVSWLHEENRGENAGSVCVCVRAAEAKNRETRKKFIRMDGQTYMGRRTREQMMAMATLLRE